jgi:hypothetical protein
MAIDGRLQPRLVSIANIIENDNYGIHNKHLGNPTQLFMKIKYIFRTPDVVISSNSYQFI